MPKLWKVAPLHSEDKILQLLFNRGIKTAQEKESFFHPQLKNFAKDLEIIDLAKAKERILTAIKNHELISVYGDYDVDGLCASAIVYHGLSFLGAKVLPYIPHREKEGYGLSKTGLDAIKEKGTNLVITVDNGIVAVEQARYAKEIGLDLIITDHHLTDHEKPEALAIVHSTKMSGAGVAWALIRKLIPEEKASELLDLVSIATICDLVPLVDLNRALVKEGLKQLNRTKRIGLLALIIESGLQTGKLKAYHVSHILGPRLNALGRLEHSLDALRLLCTKDLEKARHLAKLLSETNDQKKQLTIDAILQAKEILSTKEVTGLVKKKVIVLYSEKWIPGIIGLIAGRISEEYHKPAIIISKGESLSKGSARSVNGINIVETIRSVADCLLDVGGHPQAAGFTIETSKIEQFVTRIEEISATFDFEATEELKIEALVDPKNINKKMTEDLEDFEPTGIGNPKPLLASLAVTISNLKTVGNDQHLKFKVFGPSQIDGKTPGIEAIAFSQGSLIKYFTEGQVVDLAYFLEIDNFNGDEKIQMKIIDIRI